MAEMLRITSPLTGKSQIPQNKPEASPSEAFVLQDVNRVAAPQNKGEAHPQQVAVNTDEKAPIMKKADVAVVEDFLPLMDALSKCVK